MIRRQADRARLLVLALTVVPLVPGVALFRQAVAGDRRLPEAVGAFVFFAIAGLCVYLAARANPARPDGPLQQVGRLRGLFFVTGKPARLTIDGVTVVLPHAWLGQFAHGEVVDVEITPPLESDPRPGRARHVVSALGGRLRIAGSGPGGG